MEGRPGQEALAGGAAVLADAGAVRVEVNGVPRSAATAGERQVFRAERSS
ncbi:hypothetical protein [Sinosporangium album]|nr:hypothetical protein [Sinosporangium album]